MLEILLLSAALPAIAEVDLGSYATTTSQV